MINVKNENETQKKKPKCDAITTYSYLCDARISWEFFIVLHSLKRRFIVYIFNFKSVHLLLTLLYCNDIISLQSC